LPLWITADLVAQQANLIVGFSCPLPVLCQKAHFMAILMGEMTAEVAELGWIVAVNEKNSHRFQPSAQCHRAESTEAL
jgi:hypothetical protein